MRATACDQAESANSLPLGWKTELGACRPREIEGAALNSRGPSSKLRTPKLLVVLGMSLAPACGIARVLHVESRPSNVGCCLGSLVIFGQVRSLQESGWTWQALQELVPGSRCLCGLHPRPAGGAGITVWTSAIDSTRRGIQQHLNAISEPATTSPVSTNGTESSLGINRV